LEFVLSSTQQFPTMFAGNMTAWLFSLGGRVPETSIGLLFIVLLGLIGETIFLLGKRVLEGCPQDGPQSILRVQQSKRKGWGARIKTLLILLPGDLSNLKKEAAHIGEPFHRLEPPSHPTRSSSMEGKSIVLRSKLIYMFYGDVRVGAIYRN